MWAVGWKNPDPMVDESRRRQDNTAAVREYFNIFFEMRARRRLWLLANYMGFSMYFCENAHSK